MQPTKKHLPDFGRLVNLKMQMSQETLVRKNKHSHVSVSLSLSLTVSPSFAHPFGVAAWAPDLPANLEAKGS